MRKKIIDFVAGLAMFALGVGFIGPIGGFETGAITGGQCVVRSMVCLFGMLVLATLNSWLMEEVERRRAR